MQTSTQTRKSCRGPEQLLSLSLHTYLEAVNLDSLGHPQTSGMGSTLPIFCPYHKGAFSSPTEFGPASENGEEGASSLGWGKYLVMTESAGGESSRDRGCRDFIRDSNRVGREVSTLLPAFTSLSEPGHTQAHCLPLVFCQHFHLLALAQYQ